MDGAYLQGAGDGTKPSEITIVGAALKEAEAFLVSQGDAETAQRVDKISRLIDGFETPYGMELLATVHWVASEEAATHYDDVLRKVQGWNKRKRTIMKPEHIKAAYSRLAAEGWLSKPDA